MKSNRRNFLKMAAMSLATLALPNLDCLKLSEFDKSVIVCKRCEKRITNETNPEQKKYWIEYYNEFKEAMIVDHGKIAERWLSERVQSS